MLLSAVSVYADDYQHITINGELLTRHVKKIEFAGWKSQLYYDDDTSESIYTTTLSAIFDRTTGIADIQMFGGVTVQGDDLSMTGLAAGTPVRIFDASGRQCAQQTVAADGTLSLNVSSLQPNAVYVVKCGKTVVKFVKK